MQKRKVCLKQKQKLNQYFRIQHKSGKIPQREPKVLPRWVQGGLDYVTSLLFPQAKPWGPATIILFWWQRKVRWFSEIGCVCVCLSEADPS